MKRLVIFFSSLIFLGASSADAQTFGCEERNYTCQLGRAIRALQDNPDDPENLYNIGIVYQRMGDHSRAINSFTMYVSVPGLRPEYAADGYNNRGISQRRLKQPELAISDYNKAIELNPKKSDQFLVNRANANVDRKKAADALADYAKALAFNPKYAQAYAQRGILYSDQSRIEDALRDFAKSIELDPKYAEPYYNRGTIYSGRKEFAKAIPDYTMYISLISDPVYLADGYMNRGIANYYTGNPQKALADYSKVIELLPADPNGYRARAMLYREMKKNDLAAADELKAAELSGSQK